MFRLFVTPATVVFVLFASCCISNSARKFLLLLHLDGGMVSADAFAFDKSATKRNNVLGQLVARLSTENGDYDAGPMLVDTFVKRHPALSDRTVI